jgi:hypothetical protein
MNLIKKQLRPESGDVPHAHCKLNHLAGLHDTLDDSETYPSGGDFFTFFCPSLNGRRTRHITEKVILPSLFVSIHANRLPARR